LSAILAGMNWRSIPPSSSGACQVSPGRCPSMKACFTHEWPMLPGLEPATMRGKRAFTASGRFMPTIRTRERRKR
jgi:hypothetical protein